MPLLLLSNRLIYYVSVFQRCLPLKKQLSLRKKILPEQQSSPTHASSSILMYQGCTAHVLTLHVLHLEQCRHLPMPEDADMFKPDFCSGFLHECCQTSPTLCVCSSHRFCVLLAHCPDHDSLTCLQAYR